MTYWTYESPKGEKLKEVHVIEFPQEFIRRAKAIYDQKNKPNDEWKNKFIDGAINKTE
jgi:hypothetical protein